MHRFLSIACLLLLSSQTSLAAIPMEQHDKELRQLFQQAEQADVTTLPARIKYISQHFIGRKYQLGPLGEGPNGLFDQEPLYRTDAFDCLTYVETVLAIAKSHNLDEFKRNLQQIRYRAGEVDFIHRNHFMTVDWNKNNENQGLVRDITYQFIDENKHPVAHIAVTDINKPEWLKRMNQHYLHLHGDSEALQEQRLEELHALANQVKTEKGVLLYIPLQRLFDKKGNINQVLIQQLPDISILEIVRPNWNLKKKIGTNLNVSHVGFVIKTSRGYFFRHASSQEKAVVNLPLAAYLRKYIKNETVKGINILAIQTGGATHEAHH